MLLESKVAAMVPVSDIERAKKFYGDTLALGEPTESFPDGSVSYTCAPGSTLHLYITPENAGKSPATCASWDVADIVSLVKDLKGRGVVFEEYDQPNLKTENGIASLGPVVKAAWVKDPDGNTLAFVQPR